MCIWLLFRTDLQTISARLKERCGDVNYKQDDKSAVTDEHYVNIGHYIKFQDCKVLAHVDHYRKQLISEPIEIQKIKLPIK